MRNLSLKNDDYITIPESQWSYKTEKGEEKLIRRRCSSTCSTECRIKQTRCHAWIYSGFHEDMPLRLKISSFINLTIHKNILKITLNSIQMYKMCIKRESRKLYYFIGNRPGTLLRCP